ncbi:DUF3592 domain-containing protein [Akkermansiaceae bacterium]|nr:DUF3592 domain-containing protein [Akkermansiaceae bacterium]
MRAPTVFLIFLGLCTAALGGLFTVLMWKSYARAVEQRGWPQVDGLVLSSEVEEWRHDEFSPKGYRLKILYGYEWNGEAKSGDRYDFRGNASYKVRDRIESMVKDLPAGAKTRVYVNPDNPDFTILKPDSKAPGYSIWFPLLFVAGGMGIAVRALTRRRSQLAA